MQVAAGAFLALLTMNELMKSRRLAAAAASMEAVGTVSLTDNQESEVDLFTGVTKETLRNAPFPQKQQGNTVTVGQAGVVDMSKKETSTSMFYGQAMDSRQSIYPVVEDRADEEGRNRRALQDANQRQHGVSAVAQTRVGPGGDHGFHWGAERVQPNVEATNSRNIASLPPLQEVSGGQAEVALGSMASRVQTMGNREDSNVWIGAQSAHNSMASLRQNFDVQKQDTINEYYGGASGQIDSSSHRATEHHLKHDTDATSRQPMGGAELSAPGYRGGTCLPQQERAVGNEHAQELSLVRQQNVTAGPKKPTDWQATLKDVQAMRDQDLMLANSSHVNAHAPADRPNMATPVTNRGMGSSDASRAGNMHGVAPDGSALNFQDAVQRASELPTTARQQTQSAFTTEAGMSNTNVSSTPMTYASTHDKQANTLPAINSYFAGPQNVDRKLDRSHEPSSQYVDKALVTDFIPNVGGVANTDMPSRTTASDLVQKSYIDDRLQTDAVANQMSLSTNPYHHTISAPT